MSIHKKSPPWTDLTQLAHRVITFDIFMKFIFASSINRSSVGSFFKTTTLPSFLLFGLLYGLPFGSLLGSHFAAAHSPSTRSLNDEIFDVTQRIQLLSGEKRVQEELIYLSFLHSFFEVEKDLPPGFAPLEHKVNNRLRAYYRWWRKNPRSPLSPGTVYKIFSILHRKKAEWREEFAKTRNHALPGVLAFQTGPIAMEIASDQRIYLRLDPSIRGKGSSKQFSIALSAKTFEEVARLEFDPALALDSRGKSKWNKFVKELDLLERIKRCPDLSKSGGLVPCYGTSDTVVYTKLYAEPLADSDRLLNDQASIETLKATFAEKLDAAIQILTGVVNLKQHFGTIHMDIKPDNIFLTKLDSGYHLGVSDFGLIATQHDLETSQALPDFGTPIYMAPDLIWKDEPATELAITEFVYRSASYSTAATLQVLFEGGRSPFFIYQCINYINASDLSGFSKCVIRKIIEREFLLQNDFDASWIDLIQVRALNRSPMERPTLEALRNAYQWRLKNFAKPEREALAEPLDCAPSTDQIQAFEKELFPSILEAIDRLKSKPVGSYALYPIPNTTGSCRRIGITYVAQNYTVDRIYKHVVRPSGARLVHRPLLSNTSQPLLAEEELSTLREVGILKKRILPRKPIFARMTQYFTHGQ